MASRLVVEWTRTSVRVALAEGGGSRWRLKSVRSQPIGATGTAVEVLRGLLETSKAWGAQAIGVVPREQVITRTVKFPTTAPEELAQMAELYAKAQLPYPREQAVMDVHLLSQQEGFSVVAIVACQRDLVERQLTLLREAGLVSGLVTVSSWGVLSWYRHAVRSGAASEPALVIHVDEIRTDLVLIAGGRVLSSRSVAQGAQEWRASGETAELLALEVERSRAAVRKELPSVEVRAVILTGLDAVAQWSAPLSERLGLPVTVVGAREPWIAATAALPASSSPVVVGGLACAETGELLNLTPPEARGEARHRTQVRDLLTVGGLLVGVLVLGSGGLALQIARQQRTARQLDRALVDLEPAAKRVQEKTRSANVVRSLLGDRRRLAATLSGIFGATPASVTFESVAFERARQEVTVRGNAASTQAVLDYIRQLEALEEVSGVQLKYSTSRSGPAGERTDFELILHQGAG